MNFSTQRILKTLLFSFLLLILLTEQASSQIQEPSYNLTFLKGKYIDSTKRKEIILVFKHLAKSNQTEKLIISAKLTYSIGVDGKEITEVLGQAGAKHTITIFGDDIELKNKYIYELVKNNPNFTIDPSVRFIVFTLRNLSDKYFDTMTFTYGLWEPKDENVRIETKYQITIDK